MSELDRNGNRKDHAYRNSLVDRRSIAPLHIQLYLISDLTNVPRFSFCSFTDWDRSFKRPSPPPSPHSASDENVEAVQKLAQQLQQELKEAKSRHLDCTEVLLPADLLQRIASDMLVKSEKEPCGIRGCTIFIEFQEEPNNVRRIASLKPDQDTVSTFEFYLTLNSRSSWTSMLPAFLK